MNTPAKPTILLTVGHGPQDRATLGDLLTGAGIDMVVDIRRFPGSRRNPDVSTDELARWLPECGIAYLWEQRLGGRRSLPADRPAEDPWWTVAAFRAYAAYTRTPEFNAAMDETLELARKHTVAVMCSESVWWRCHRRLVADVAILGRQVPVLHLMLDGRLSPHRPSEGARAADGGLLVWDRPADS